MKKLNNLGKIIFSIVLFLNILQAETELIPNEFFNSTVEESINNVNQKEKISEIKNSNNNITQETINPFFKLTIKPNIADADIMVRNVVATYKPKMLLPGNRQYNMKVSRRGYKTKKFSIILKSNKPIPVTLEKKKKVKKKVKHTKKTRPKKKRVRYCSLTIQPNKRGAQVFITNISETYRNGIRLTCGRTYNIKVTKRGCTTRRFTTHLRHNEVIPVRLSCR